MEGDEKLLAAVPYPSKLVGEKLEGEYGSCPRIYHCGHGRDKNTSIVVFDIHAGEVVDKDCSSCDGVDLSLKQGKVVINKRDELGGND